MTQPTAKEQEMLYYINRMRTNPTAEYNLLVNSGDSDVASALSFFNVNLTVLQTQWNTLTAAQPVAWSEQLGDASQTHSGLMITNDQQSHQLPGEPTLGTRITNTGYIWNSLGENVFAFADSVFYGHAGFAIDWGSTSTGIQDPPGHRNTIMNNSLREVGIDVTEENNSATSVGPLVITQDFGNRSALNNKGWLVGSAFRDLSGDNFYDAGEGLNNVTINIAGINGTTFNNTFNSWAAGGYQILLNPGNYQAQFTWEGNLVKSQNFSISSQNVLIDLLIEAGADPLPGKGKIIGNIFNDANANKTWDGTETGLSGWTVFLDTNKNQQLDVGETSTTTDSKGEYILNNITPGVYNVVEVLPSGWVQTFPDANNPNGNETYKLDDGISDGATSYGTQDHLIFNRFEAISGLNNIGTISVGLSSYGNPTKIFIYQDLDNDDIPDGNEKIRELATSLSGTTGFTTVDIQDITVSGTFFIAALYPGNGSTNNWIVRDNTIPQNNSFIALANAGTLNPSSFSAFAVSGNNWLLRANAVSNNSPQTATVVANQTVVNLNFGNQNSAPSLPIVSIAATDSSATETAGNSGTFTFTRTGSTTNSLTVQYTIAGTATNGSDYNTVNSNITFNAGQSQVSLNIIPIDDTLLESDETVQITLTDTATYDLNASNIATITISDNDAGQLITGDANNNNLVGGTGNDTIQGLGGNDTLNGGLGADSLVGGDGSDIYYVDNLGDVVVETNSVASTGGTDTVNSTVTYTLSANVEKLTLTGTTAINGTGNALANTLTGNTGINTLTGGDGNDIYYVQNIEDVVVETNSVASTGGTDTVHSSVTYTLSANVEKLTLTGTTAINGTGNALANTLTGNTGINTLTGGDGNDIYYVQNIEDVVVETNSVASTGGTDTVNSTVTYTLSANVEKLTLTGTTAINGTGNALANTLTGNTGANTLTGGDGNDTLLGGSGADSLTGGMGLDSFRFNSPSEGIDRITDFAVVDDTIQVSASGFGAGLVANAAITTSQFTLGASATTTTQRFGYNSGTGSLWFDSDGSGATAAVQIATLNTGLALTNADIYVV